MSNQTSELLKKLIANFDDLRDKANITNRGEVSKNPSSVEMRPK